jgi:dTDP-4-amino-4,6-dideoxygalactose transaminase
MTELNERGIACTVGSCSEIYLEKAFIDRGWGPQQRLPVARTLGETSLMFMVHPTLPAEAQEATVQAVRDVAGRATR